MDDDKDDGEKRGRDDSFSENSQARDFTKNRNIHEENRGTNATSWVS